MLETCGKKQFYSFFWDRLIFAKVEIDATISRNQFALPGNISPVLKKDSSKSMILKEATFNKLRSAIEFRGKEAQEVFKHELFGVFQSIVATPSTLYHALKSAILNRFQTVNNKPSFRDERSAFVVELSAMVLIKAKCDAETFHDFSLIMYTYIIKQGKNYERIDVVCDQYFADSLKEGTRKERGSGTQKNFDDSTNFPPKMREDFLKNAENKESLNRYLASKFMTFHSGSKILTITYGNTILSSAPQLFEQLDIFHCTAEEADPRLVGHSMNGIRNGYKNVVVRTVDTDVLILLISYFPFMKDNDSQVYALLGNQATNQKLYHVNKLSCNLGLEFCKGLPFFYSFTGCDTVSSMFEIFLGLFSRPIKQR